MKSKKLIILLTLVLSLSFLFVACSQDVTINEKTMRGEGIKNEEDYDRWVNEGGYDYLAEDIVLTYGYNYTQPKYELDCEGHTITYDPDYVPENKGLQEKKQKPKSSTKSVATVLPGVSLTITGGSIQTKADITVIENMGNTKLDNMEVVATGEENTQNKEANEKKEPVIKNMGEGTLDILDTRVADKPKDEETSPTNLNPGTLIEVSGGDVKFGNGSGSGDDDKKGSELENQGTIIEIKKSSPTDFKERLEEILEETSDTNMPESVKNAVQDAIENPEESFTTPTVLIKGDTTLTPSNPTTKTDGTVPEAAPVIKNNGGGDIEFEDNAEIVVPPGSPSFYEANSGDMTFTNKGSLSSKGEDDEADKKVMRRPNKGAIILWGDAKLTLEGYEIITAYNSTGVGPCDPTIQLYDVAELTLINCDVYAESEAVYMADSAKLTVEDSTFTVFNREDCQEEYSKGYAEEAEIVTGNRYDKESSVKAAISAGYSKTEVTGNPVTSVVLGGDVSIKSNKENGAAIRALNAEIATVEGKKVNLAVKTKHTSSTAILLDSSDFNIDGKLSVVSAGAGIDSKNTDIILKLDDTTASSLNIYTTGTSFKVVNATSKDVYLSRYFKVRSSDDSAIDFTGVNFTTDCNGLFVFAKNNGIVLKNSTATDFADVIVYVGTGNGIVLENTAVEDFIRVGVLADSGNDAITVKNGNKGFGDFSVVTIGNYKRGIVLDSAFKEGQDLSTFTTVTDVSTVVSFDFTSVEVGDFVNVNSTKAKTVVKASDTNFTNFTSDCSFVAKETVFDLTNSSIDSICLKSASVIGNSAKSVFNLTDSVIKSLNIESAVLKDSSGNLTGVGIQLTGKDAVIESIPNMKIEAKKGVELTNGALISYRREGNRITPTTPSTLEVITSGNNGIVLGSENDTQVSAINLADSSITVSGSKGKGVAIEGPAAFQLVDCFVESPEQGIYINNLGFGAVKNGTFSVVNSINTGKSYSPIELTKKATSGTDRFTLETFGEINLLADTNAADAITVSGGTFVTGISEDVHPVINTKNTCSENQSLRYYITVEEEGRVYLVDGTDFRSLDPQINFDFSAKFKDGWNKEDTWYTYAEPGVESSTRVSVSGKAEQDGALGFTAMHVVVTFVDASLKNVSAKASTESWLVGWEETRHYYQKAPKGSLDITANLSKNYFNEKGDTNAAVPDFGRIKVYRGTTPTNLVDGSTCAVRLSGYWYTNYAGSVLETATVKDGRERETAMDLYGFVADANNHYYAAGAVNCGQLGKVTNYYYDDDEAHNHENAGWKQKEGGVFTPEASVSYTGGVLKVKLYCDTDSVSYWYSTATDSNPKIKLTLDSNNSFVATEGVTYFIYATTSKVESFNSIPANMKSKVLTFTAEIPMIEGLSYSIVNGMIKPSCTTQGVTYKYIVTSTDLDLVSDSDFKELTGKSFSASVGQNVAILAEKDGYKSSRVTVDLLALYTNLFTIKLSDAITVTGNHGEIVDQKIDITSEHSSKTDIYFYYTDDGTTPTRLSPRIKYGESISVSEACTIKVIATLDGCLDSDIMKYEVKNAPAIKLTQSIKYSSGKDYLNVVSADSLNVINVNTDSIFVMVSEFDENGGITSTTDYIMLSSENESSLIDGSKTRMFKAVCTRLNTESVGYLYSASNQLMIQQIQLAKPTHVKTVEHKNETVQGIPIDGYGCINDGTNPDYTGVIEIISGNEKYGDVKVYKKVNGFQEVNTSDPYNLTVGRYQSELSGTFGWLVFIEGYRPSEIDTFSM